jgi:hypothetical protein
MSKTGFQMILESGEGMVGHQCVLGMEEVLLEPLEIVCAGSEILVRD